MAIAVALESEPRVEPRDVVFALSFTTWSGAVGRGLCMPEDRLAAALPSSERVRRLLVCDPYRGLPVKTARTLLGSREAPFPTSETVGLHQPLRLRRFDPTSVRAIERSFAAYDRSVRQAAEALGLERPAIITTHPLLAGFGRFEWAGAVTYYAWDDWAASQPHRRWWPSYGEGFARIRSSGHRVVAVSEAVLRRVAPTGPQAVVPNGVEASEWLRPRPAPPWFAELSRPRLLYTGALDGRLDVAQVARVADARPEASVSLVGPVQDESHLAPLLGLPNVRLFPPVDRCELAGLVAAADACLIPHVRTAMTEAMSPLKLYEYLAAGRPVAAVDLPPILGVSPRVALAPAGGDLLPAVERALDLGPAAEGERRRFIAENAWERRFKRILDVALAP